MFDIAFFLALIQLNHPTKAACGTMRNELINAVFANNNANFWLNKNSHEIGSGYPNIKDDVDAVDAFYKKCLKKAKK